MIKKYCVKNLYLFSFLFGSTISYESFAQNSESEIPLETSMTAEEYVDYITGKSETEVLSPFIVIGDSNVSNETIKLNSGESRSIREVLIEYEEKVQNTTSSASFDSELSEEYSLGMSALFRFSNISGSAQVFGIENLADLLSHNYKVAKADAVRFIQYVEAVNNEYTSKVSTKKVEFCNRYFQEKSSLGVNAATNNIVNKFNELNDFTSDYYYTELIAIQNSNDALLTSLVQDINSQVANMNRVQYDQEPMMEILGINIDEHYLKLCNFVLSEN